MLLKRGAVGPPVCWDHMRGAVVGVRVVRSSGTEDDEQHKLMLPWDPGGCEGSRPLRGRLRRPRMTAVWGESKSQGVEGCGIPPLGCAQRRLSRKESGKWGSLREMGTRLEAHDIRVARPK